LAPPATFGGFSAFSAPTQIVTGSPDLLSGRVADPAGDRVDAIHVYRDLNGNGVLDPDSDQLLLADTTPADGYAFNAGSLPSGRHVLYVAAIKDGAVAGSITTTLVAARWWSVSISGLTDGESQLPTTGNLVADPAPIELAPGPGGGTWKDAVTRRVSGTLTTTNPGSQESHDYGFLEPGSDYTVPAPGSAFAIGTAGELRAAFGPRHNIAVAADTRLIVLEDLVKFTSAVNDNDYDDQYFVVTLTPVLVDLDVDSDNTGTLDHSAHEDGIEEATDNQGAIVRPGVIVPVGGGRVPMVADVPAGMTATLEFDAAAAQKVKVFSPSGAVALDQGRLSTTVVGGELRTFWIEAFAPSTSMADIIFTLTLDGGQGSGSTTSPPSDMIRATAVAVDLDVDSNNDGEIDTDNGPLGKDDRIEDDPESPGVRVPVQGQRSEMRLGSHATQPTASRLQIDSGAGNVELWNASTGGTRLTLDAQAGINWAAGQRPAAVWIQAVRPSDEVGDIRFTLTESFGASGNLITLSDTVRATAMAEVMLFFHFDTQTALDELEDSLPPPTAIDQTGMLVLTPADSAALQARRAAWLAGHLATPTVAGTGKSFAELQNAVTAAEGKLTSARAAAAAMTSMRG
jgi:hypothetical protein